MSRPETRPNNRGLLVILSTAAALLTITLVVIARPTGSALVWALAAASLAAAGSVGVSLGAAFIRRRIEQRHAEDGRPKAQLETSQVESARRERPKQGQAEQEPPSSPEVKTGSGTSMPMPARDAVTVGAGVVVRAERAWQANSKLLYPGIGFVAAAIVGGGLKFASVEVPLLRAPAQQILLGNLGALMILGSFLVRDVPKGEAQTRDDGDLVVSLPATGAPSVSMLIVIISVVVAVVGTVTIEARLPPPSPPPPAVCAGQLAFGQTIDCSVEQPTQVRTHAFDGETGQQVRVTVSRLSGDFTPAYDIHRPDGSRLCGTIQPGIDCRLDTSGRHTITVGAFVNRGTGRYSLSLTRLDRPPGSS